MRDFARFCIDRIEREIGRAAWWTVNIVPSSVCYSCEVIAEHQGLVVRELGEGFDAAVAGRQAFCKIERVLHDNYTLLGLSKQEAIRAER